MLSSCFVTQTSLADLHPNPNALWRPGEAANILQVGPVTGSCSNINVVKIISHVQLCNSYENHEDKEMCLSYLLIVNSYLALVFTCLAYVLL